MSCLCWKAHSSAFRSRHDEHLKADAGPRAAHTARCCAWYTCLSPRSTIRLAAGTYDVPGKGEFSQVFASGAFDSQIGYVVEMTIEGRWVANVRIIAADVSEDGLSVELTYEVL